MSKSSHPRALVVLFATEMWERLAFFGVQSLLVLYMTHGLHFNDGRAYFVFGSMAAAMFALPLLGGTLADRKLGYFPTALLGASCLVLGYALLLFHTTTMFFLAIGLIAIGTGLFKPNVSTLLGTFYKEGDTCRDQGFTLFYLGINVGSVLGIIVCAIVRQWAGWHAAFACAVVSTLITIGIFLYYRKPLISESYLPERVFPTRVSIVGRYCVLIAIILVLLYPIGILMSYAGLMSEVVDIIGVLLLMYLVYQLGISRREERKRLFVCIVLMFFAIIFWALYQQIPMTLTLFADRDVNLTALGFHIPTSLIWSLNGLFIILFSPVMIFIWRGLQSSGREPSVVYKFAFGILLMGLGHWVLAFQAHMVTVKHLAPLWPMVVSYGLQTTGELMLSPIGLSMVTYLAPERIRGMMMGVWFFVLSAATMLGSHLAQLAKVPKPFNALTSADIYEHAFRSYGNLAVVAAIILMILGPWLTRLIMEPKKVYIRNSVNEKGVDDA